MTHEPTLVIMAAGMGSRFGGLKQMTPVDEEGHFIIDFSLYDAYQAGFRRVAFIIKREIEQTFRKTIGARMAGGVRGPRGTQKAMGHGARGGLLPGRGGRPVCRHQLR